MIKQFLTKGRNIEINKYYLCYYKDTGELCKIIMVTGGYAVICYYWETEIIKGTFEACRDWVVKHYYE